MVLHLIISEKYRHILCLWYTPLTTNYYPLSSQPLYPIHYLENSQLYLIFQDLWTTIMLLEPNTLFSCIQIIQCFFKDCIFINQVHNEAAYHRLWYYSTHTVHVHLNIPMYIKLTHILDQDAHLPSLHKSLPLSHHQ